MYKKILSGLMLITFLSSQLISLAQDPGMAPQTPPANQQVLPAPNGANSPSIAPPQNIPPIILIAGKERESFQKVFIDKVKVGDEINVKLLMFDREPTEDIKVNSYGLPASAKLTIKKDDKGKNRAEADLTWKPEKSDKGFHTIVIEVLNSKGATSRVSLSYDVS